MDQPINTTDRKPSQIPPLKKGRPIGCKPEPGCILKTGQFAWKVLYKLGTGGFGDVYKVVKDEDPIDTTEYALKSENSGMDKWKRRLKVEVAVLMSVMEGPTRAHFVELLDRGKSEKFKFMVISLVGVSLEDYRRKKNNDFSPSSAVQIGIQSLEAVADLHNIGWIHRDIKPQNFAIGLGEKIGIVYMLDFGLARRIFDANGNIVTPRVKVKFLGTYRFASRSSHFLLDQAMKDDLEMWIYMVFDVFDRTRGLPWRTVNDPRSVFNEKICFFDKDYFEVYYGDGNAVLLKLWPMVEYVDSMLYFSEPNYEKIKQIIRDASKKNGVNISEKLDWMEEKK